MLALLPTLLYIVTISELGNPPGNWDVGSTVGSYIGLSFLVFAYAAIGIFASTLSQNQIVAFISAVFLCFIFYYGFDALDQLFPDASLGVFGMKYHFDSVSRGVLDTRDLLYFLSVSVFFLVLTIFNLRKK